MRSGSTALLRWLLTFVWAWLGAAGVFGAMIGATWLLRVAREVYHPWYARPGPAVPAADR